MLLFLQQTLPTKEGPIVLFDSRVTWRKQICVINAHVLCKKPNVSITNILTINWETDQKLTDRWTDRHCQCLSQHFFQTPLTVVECSSVCLHTH